MKATKGKPRGTTGRGPSTDPKKQVYGYYSQAKAERIENIIPVKELIPKLLDKFIENNMEII